MTLNFRRMLGGCFVVALAFSLVWSASPLEAASPQESSEQGLKAFQRGAFEDAISNWTDAANSYQQEGKTDQQLATLSQLAEAYIVLGQYRQAVKTLETALELAQKSRDATQIPSLLARLGNAHIPIGPPETAEEYLTRGLGMARERNDAELTAVILNNLGNLYSTQKKYAEAIAAYKESVVLAKRAGRRILAARAMANTAAALRWSGEAREARAQLDMAMDELRGLPPSQEAAFALINIGLGFRDLRPSLPDASAPLVLRAAGAFSEARSMAERLGDRRTASYAIGYLGTLYEAEGLDAEALQLTHQAIFAAQQIYAPESLYRWQWQEGRLLKRLGRNDDAISAYQRAVRTLQSVHLELAISYGGPPASFRETVGPVYSELADLLLQRAASAQTPEARDPLLLQARDTIELFKVAELRDYFEDDCVDRFLSKIAKLDVVSPTAAVIYPILLSDRTELLVSLPSGLKRFAVPVGADAMTKEVREFRRTLEKRTTKEYLRHSRQLYTWLIRPLEADLASAQIDTLVFVPDGPLRTIPMAALHDGKQYLVEKYALAITPGLNLTDPRPINRKATKVLAVGVTEPVQGFPPLPYVEAELEAVKKVFPNDTELINGQFRLGTLEKELKEEPFTIVHIATHAQFGGDVQNTFLLTFDSKLTIGRLDEIVGVFKYRTEPLDVLTLSACETAEGDDRAALGLAGVAVKAGARSAVATLWNVDDQAAADLIAEFYRQLQEPSVSRATALRRAQVKILTDPRYEHASLWSPFLLINNWL